LTALLWVQGAYYLVTGVWPLVSIETFQMVTGPKTDHLVTGREADHWLVMTVGVLVTAIGFTLLVAAWRRRCPVEVALLAVASAAGLTGIDVLYVARQVIPPVYLVDAAAEVVLIVAWVLLLIRQLQAGRAEGA
jgi:CHASE2 domain-containing sensor protein